MPLQYNSATDTRICEAVRIIAEGSCDRRSLADAMGISVSTVSKLVLDMSSAGIIGEYAGKSDTAGRKSGILYLRNDPIIAVTDISSEKIDTTLFGYGMKTAERFTYRFDEPLFFDDCFLSYIRMLSKRRPKIACLCIVADAYPIDGIFRGCGIDGLNSFPIRDTVTEFLGDIPVILENRPRFIPNETNGMIAVVSESDRRLCTTLLHNGTVISFRGDSTSDMTGEILDHNNRSCNAGIRYAKSYTEYISAVASLINSLLRLLDIDKIYFSSERYNAVDVILDGVTEKLILDFGHTPASLPEIQSSDRSAASESARLRTHLRDCLIGIKKFHS